MPAVATDFEIGKILIRLKSKELCRLGLPKGNTRGQETACVLKVTPNTFPTVKQEERHDFYAFL